jgi:hypothetical protein
MNHCKTEARAHIAVQRWNDWHFMVRPTCSKAIATSILYGRQTFALSARLPGRSENAAAALALPIVPDHIEFGRGRGSRAGIPGLWDNGEVPQRGALSVLIAIAMTAFDVTFMKLSMRHNCKI